MNKKILQLTGALALTAVVIGCTFKVPGAPIWTIEASVPFSERVYRMGELVTDSARMAHQRWGIEVSPIDSVLQFESRDSLQYQAIGDRLTYSASSVGNYNNQMGVIHVEQPLPDADTVNISEANPLLHAGYHGPILAFNLQEAQDSLKYNIFQWVRIRRGVLYLTVTNGYPFEIQNLTVRLTNKVNQQVLGTIIFGHPIPANSSGSDSLDLSGKLVYNSLLLTANGRSPGSQAAVDITGNELLRLAVGISSTDVDSANAEVAAQSFSNPDQLQIDSRNKIVRAEIKHGTAYFRLTNTTPFRVRSDMVFANLLDSTGALISKTLTLEPMTAGGLTTLDLNRSVVTMPLNNQGLQVTNQVTVEDSRVTRYRGQTYQTIASYQGVQVEYWTDALTLSHFEGIVDSITVDIPETVTPVQFPDGLDSLHFARDTVFVFLDNQTTMPLKLDFDVTGTNSHTRQSISLPVIADLVPGNNIITIPNADRLTSVLPDTIRVLGSASLGRKFFPALGVGTIDQSQGFAGEVLIRSGLKFTIGQTRVITKPDSIGALDYPLQSADMRIHLINSIPLAGRVQLLIGNDTSRMVPIIQVDIPRHALHHNRVVSSADTTYTIGLGSTELAILKQTPVYTQQILTFLSSNGDTAWVYPSDSLAVQASATVRYTINPKNGGH